MPSKNIDAGDPWHRKIRHRLNNRLVDLAHAREGYADGRITVNLAWLLSILAVLIVLGVAVFVLLRP